MAGQYLKELFLRYPRHIARQSYSINRIDAHMLVHHFQRFFQQRPLLAQCTVGAALFVAGDLIAQVVIERCLDADGIDIRRPIAFGLYGFCISVPLTATWYRFLDMRLKYTTALQRTAKQVFLDQAFFAPPGIAIYFTCTNLLLGHPGMIKEKLSNEYFDALWTNYAIWPWIQMLNFYFVPLNYRTVVVNTAALGWNTYMSWLNNRRKKMD